jgi:hypothetical protein
MHQRFAAGEDNPFDAKPAKFIDMLGQQIGCDLLPVPIGPPDIAHDAAAVAAAVWHQDHDRQRVNPMRLERQLPFRDLEWRTHAISSFPGG